MSLQPDEDQTHSCLPNDVQTPVIILCSGEGRRLRPMTAERPKPLTPFFHKPIVEHLLDQLTGQGLHSVAVNVHHLADQVVSFMNRYQGLSRQPTIFKEHHLLGSGGSLAPILASQTSTAQQSTWVINSDVIFELDFKRVSEEHRASEADLTLVVTETPMPGERPVLVDSRNRMLGFGSAEPSDLTHVNSSQALQRGFGCIQLLGPRFKALLLDHATQQKQDHFSILPVYEQALNQGLKLNTYTTSQLWLELGTPERLRHAHCSYIHKHLYQDNPLRIPCDHMLELTRQRTTHMDRQPSFWFDTSTHINKTATLSQGACILGQSHIEAGSYVEGSLLIDACLKEGHTSRTEVLWRGQKL